MSISLLDKVEAVYELKRLHDRVHLTPDEEQLLDTLVQYVMRENKRLAQHTLRTRMTHTLRNRVLRYCPTVNRWLPNE